MSGRERYSVILKDGRRVLDRLAVLPSNGFAVLVFLLVVICSQHSVVFCGRSLVATNAHNPLDPSARVENYGPAVTHIAESASRNLKPYANFHDPGVAWWQCEPSGEYLRKALRDREWPLWDPYIAAGTPAMTNLTGGFFFPPYLLVILAGNGILLRNLYFLLLMSFAGYFTFLLLRAHGLGFIPGIAAGVAFLFSGSIVQNVNSLLGQTWSCMPFALWLTDWLLQQPSVRRIAGVAVGYASVALSSFPPLLVALFGTCALYAAVLIAFEARPLRLRAVIAYGSAVALSLSLVAFYYLPFAGMLPSTPHVSRFYETAANVTVPPRRLVQLLSPVLTGGSKVFSDPPFPSPGDGDVPYAGVVTVFLALLSWPDGRRQRLLHWTTTGVLVVTAMKIVGAPGIQAMARLPVIRSMHFVPYFGYLLDFLLAVLAGFGLERLCRGKVMLGRSLLVTLAILVAFLAIGHGAIQFDVPAHPHFRDWLTFWRRSTLLAAIVSCALLVASLATRRHWITAAAGVVLLSLVFESVVNSVYPRPLRWDVWRNPPPYVRHLSRDVTDRVFTAGALPANAGSALGIAELDSLCAFNPPRIHRLHREYVAPGGQFMAAARMLPPDGVLDAAAITQLVFNRGNAEMIIEAERRGYERVYEDAAVHIFRRRSAPRHFFTTDYRVLHASQALRALGGSAKEREILLEQVPQFAPSPNGSLDRVVMKEHTRNGFVLAITAPRAGLLYSAESFFPGWKAWVNGKEARILTANYAFRAVEIPSGPVLIRYSYEPPLLKAGVALSILAALTCLSLVLYGAPRPDPNSKHVPAQNG
jgi:hypothetical protein